MSSFGRSTRVIITHQGAVLWPWHYTPGTEVNEKDEEPFAEYVIAKQQDEDERSEPWMY